MANSAILPRCCSKSPIVSASVPISMPPTTPRSICKPPYRLAGDTSYTYEQICDAELKNNFGAERGLDWFKQNGLIKWKKKPEEVYWRPFVDVRVPIYWEFLKPIGEKIAAIAEPRGLKIPLEYYDPLPDFLPCRSHCCEKPGFDLFAFYYRDIIHTNSFTMENPWLDEAAQLDPFSYTIAINASRRQEGAASRTASRSWVETETGRKVEGPLEAHRGHPSRKASGFAAMCGHWGDGMPIAKGKGVFFNDLAGTRLGACIAPTNINLDLCVKVRVVPAERVS